MLTFRPRAGLWPLALTLTAVTACADDHPTTAPRAPTHSRDITAGNVVLVTNTSPDSIPGSLRWALGETDGGRVIQFDPSIAGATIALPSTLEAFTVLNIEGPADKGITITSASGRVIRARLGGTFRNVTISGGTEQGSGSGIWTGGPLVLEHSTVSDNTGNGGAIHGFDITLRNSTVSNNTGYGPAAGISYGSNATVRLFNSTVAFNNPAPGIGMVQSQGGMANVMVHDSIIANNGFGLNCGIVDGIVFGGRNIAGDASCGSSEGLVVADPLLATLADNGGPTRTIAFAPQSPARNGTAGQFGCTVTVDQRYVARDAICDVGAYEFTDFTAVTLTLGESAVTNAQTGVTTVTGTVSCSRAGDQFSVVVDLEQTQKTGKTTTVVRGAGSVGITCSTTAQPWSVAVAALDGRVFAAGQASAAARTNNTPEWVTPGSTSRTIKLVRPPRR